MVGGWRESINNQTATMAGDNKQQEHVVVDEGSDNEGKGGKGNVDGNEGGGQQRGQGWQGQWCW